MNRYRKGKRRRWRRHRSAYSEPIPRRDRVLENDVWYPCSVCGFVWPKKKLRASRDGQRNVVCPNDDDDPTMTDLQAKRSDVQFERWDRHQLSLERFF